MKLIQKSLLAIFLISSCAFCFSIFAGDRHSVYRIEESAPPPQAILNLEYFFHQWAAPVIELLRWKLSDSLWSEPSEKYDRRKHFGGWLKGSDCLTTRSRVLIRDSNSDVEMDARGCNVVSGEWHEPYKGKRVYKASEIQIDHLVPLKNAFVSGAWRWDFRTRCAYTNFMYSEFHLVAVDAQSNMSKGDDSPDRWMPPNQGFACTYLKYWLSVKLLWGLVMTEDETHAIKELIGEFGCSAKNYHLSRQDFEKIRAEVAASYEACPMR